MRVFDFLDYQAREHAETDFAICGNERITYGAALTRIHRLANAMLTAGLEQGDRFAILSKNRIEVPLLYYAAFKVGAVPVPLNYRLVPAEWTFICNNAMAKAIFVDGEFGAQVEAMRQQLEHVQQFCALDAPVSPRWHDLPTWTADSPASVPKCEISEEHELFQMYTSGTTGRPKGAVLTQRAIAANLSQLAPVAYLFPGERYLIVAPLYHAAATVATFNCVAWGGTLYLERDFDPVEVVRVLSEERIAGTTLVPTMIQACLNEVPDAAQRSYQNLRFIAYGASPISEMTLRQAMKVFACDFAQRYGTTETAVVTWLTPQDHQRALTKKPELLLSAGRPLPGTEVRAVDEHDRPLPHHALGELVVRGPQLMRGYWDLPEETQRALRGGWMHTGDVGMIDEEGYVYIQDRVKDMIVTGGENVYSREIEDVLCQHPAVAEVAVIGVPHQKWGETIKAIVVLRPGKTASSKEITEYCRARLAGFKRPRSVEFVPVLPRNASGKVLKRELREPFWRGQQRRVAGA